MYIVYSLEECPNRPNIFMIDNFEVFSVRRREGVEPVPECDPVQPGYQLLHLLVRSGPFAQLNNCEYLIKPYSDSCSWMRKYVRVLYTEHWTAEQYIDFVGPLWLKNPVFLHFFLGDV